jgi:hypothetical protein
LWNCKKEKDIKDKKEHRDNKISGINPASFSSFMSLCSLSPANKGLPGWISALPGWDKKKSRPRSFGALTFSYPE